MQPFAIWPIQPQRSNTTIRQHTWRVVIAKFGRYRQWLGLPVAQLLVLVLPGEDTWGQMVTFILAIILLTSLVQSLSPQHGFPYFVLLVVESLLALVWGAWRRVKDSSERERKTAVRPMWSLPN